MKSEIKYGIITGIGICLWVLAEYILGFHNSRLEIGKYSGYFSSIFPIIFYTIALKEIRGEGTLSISQGLKAGLIVSVITAVITTAFFQIYNLYINPEWIDLAIEWEKNNLFEAGASELEITAYIEEIKEMYSPMGQLFWGLIGTIAMGMIIAFVITLFLKRK